MKLPRIRMLLLIVPCFFSLLPQEAGAGSVYSRMGIGLPRYTTSIAAAGMGGAGLASLDRSTLNYLNPAALSFYAITRFDGSALLENNRIKLADNSGRFADTNFYSFQVAIPIKKGYGIGIGLLPYSQVAYEMSGKVKTSAYQGEQTLEGKGTLTRGFISFGGSLGDHLVYGLGVDIFFGRLQRTWWMRIETGGFKDTRDVLSNYVRGASGHFGVAVRLANKLNLGAVAYLPASLSTTTTIGFGFGPSKDIEEAKVKLPFSYGYGVSFYPSQKWLLAADLFLQNWGDLQPDELLGARPNSTVTFAAGVEFVPSVDQSEGIIRRMSYRVGFRTTDLPYLDENGEKVRESVFTFGFTLPYYFYRSKIDLAFEIGRRGNLDRNFAEEKIFRMVVGFTSGEKWFRR